MKAEKTDEDPNDGIVFDSTCSACTCQYYRFYDYQVDFKILLLLGNGSK